MKDLRPLKFEALNKLQKFSVRMGWRQLQPEFICDNVGDLNTGYGHAPNSSIFHIRHAQYEEVDPSSDDVFRLKIYDSTGQRVIVALGAEPHHYSLTTDPKSLREALDSLRNGEAIYKIVLTKEEPLVRLNDFQTHSYSQPPWGGRKDRDTSLADVLPAILKMPRPVPLKMNLENM